MENPSDATQTKMSPDEVMFGDLFTLKFASFAVFPIPEVVTGDRMKAQGYSE